MFLPQLALVTSRSFAQLGRAAVRFVFPLSCPLCHGDIVPSAERAQEPLIAPMLCRRCCGDVSPPAANRCRKCGLPVGPYVSTDNGCPMCRAQKFRFEQVIRFGLYDDLLRRACILAKSSTQFPLAAGLANLLWQSERDDFAAANVDVVIPVPCHWTRRVARPHHAAETIARVLARRLDKPLCRAWLRKVRLTPDQSDLPASQRRLNLKGAFAVWPRTRALDGKTVLLVDDILTTGTTANECTRVLLRAGARRVVVAVIAVVPPRAR